MAWRHLLRSLQMHCCRNSKKERVRKHPPKTVSTALKFRRVHALVTCQVPS